MEEEYVTLTNGYIESVWALVKADPRQRGLLYRGFKTVPYSTRSGTTLSDHELALGYRDVEDPSVTVRFRRRGRGRTRSSWSGPPRPGRCPGNAAIAVHPDVDLREGPKGDGETLILARRSWWAG